MALLSIKTKYIALTLVVKEATWIKLLLTKLRLLKTEDQYVSDGNNSIQALKDNTRVQKEEKEFSISPESQAANTLFKPIIINKLTNLVSMKSNNQSSISLAHNLVFYA